MFLFNFSKFIITKNNVKYDNSKKNIVLIIRKSPGEIDWILPLLFNLKEKFNIFTIFQKKITLDLLKKNEELYELWKYTSYASTIQPPFRQLVKRFFLKIFFFANKTKIYKNFSIKTNNKIYNFFDLQEEISKKYNIKNFTPPSAVFFEFTNKSFWLNALNKINSNLKIIYFPHTSTIFSLKNQKYKSKIYKKFNELLLLSNQKDVPYWRNHYPNSKIIVSGYLKYEKNWINKILKFNSNKNKRLKKKKIIFVAIDGYHEKINREKYFYQIQTLMDVCLKFKNIFIIFKLHPFTPNKIFLKIMSKYPKQIWKISNSHLISLGKICDVFVSFYYSATSLEGLAVGKSPIELWNTKYDEKNSIYKKLNLVIHANNRKHLEIALKKQLNNKKKLLKDSIQIRNFKKICKIKNVNYATKNKVIDFIEIKNI